MQYEMGYQYLNTGFTGSFNQALSGNSLFPIPPQDTGTSGTLASKELTSLLPSGGEGN